MLKNNLLRAGALTLALVALILAIPGSRRAMAGSFTAIAEYAVRFIQVAPSALPTNCSGNDCIYVSSVDDKAYHKNTSGTAVSLEGGGGASVSITCGTGLSCSPSTITGTGTISSTGGASFPLTNGTSSWTANYAGTNTGSSVDYVFDATNAAVAGDKHFSFRTGTTEFMSLQQSFTGIWDFTSANANIGLLNSTGDGIRAQGANTVYLYASAAPQVELLGNNGIFPFNNNSIYNGTVDNAWKWTASEWEAAPLGASLTSASTVTPTSSAHPLTGTTTVNTIATTNIPTGTATVKTTETFICAAACVFGTGGNISVGFTGVAGESYTFTWDGTAWRPPGTLAGAVTASTLTSGTLPVATGGSTLANSGFTASGGTFDLASAGTATLFGTTATNIQIGHTAVQTKISGAFALGTQAATMTATTSVTTSSGPVAKLTYASATNVTSMTLTAPGIDGQEMTVMLIQPASGTAATMTTTWTNVNFAGTAVFTATLGKRDVYTFAFDATTSKWYERSRSLNLSN